MQSNLRPSRFRWTGFFLLAGLLLVFWGLSGERDGKGAIAEEELAAKADDHSHTPSALPEILSAGAAADAEGFPAATGAGQSWSDFFAERDDRQTRPLELRPIEDYPILTWADRIDMEGQPAPRIPRGQHNRRILDDPVTREVRRDNPEPIRPFGPARAAREESLFAHDHYARSAVEVGLSNRIFHEAATGERYRMVVPLTEEKEVTVDLEKIISRGPHTFSFIGKVEEHEDSVAILVYNEGTVSGGITLYGMDTWDSLNYEFMAMEDGLVAVRELEPEAYLQQPCGTCGMVHAMDVMHPQAGGMGEGDPGGVPAGDSPMGGEVDHIVDIVVGYGQEGRIAEGGVAAIEGRILASIERMNISFANSGIDNTRLVLLGMMEDPDYLFSQWSGGLQSEHNALQSGSHFQSIRDLGVELGADLVALVVKDSRANTAGVANTLGRYSVTARTYMSNNHLAFVHEIGHNYGLHHSWGDTTGDVFTNRHRYGWRHRSGSTRRRTVMSYDWGWQAVMHFANPDVNNPALGVPTGAVDGYDATGDNTTDDRYVSGGLIGTAGAGFDGSNPDLGARAAQYIIAEASQTANYAVRSGFTVTAPVEAETVPVGETYWIEWVGGVYGDDVRVELWQGGLLLSVLADEIKNHARTLIWNPEQLPTAQDYQIRLVLNDGEEEVLSAPFSIEPDYPKVVGTFVSQLGQGMPGLDEVSVTFSRSMDPASFDLQNDVTRFIGPDGEDLRASLTGYAWSENDTVLTFTFTPLQDPGFYRLDFGPDIQDLRGFPMDQNSNDIPGEIDDGFGFSFLVGTQGDTGGTITVFETDFSTNPGFTLGSGWQVGAPNQAAVGGPGAPYAGSNVLGTFLQGNFPAGVNTDAFTPSINLEGGSEVTLTFRRWIGLERLPKTVGWGSDQDRAWIHYSIDGGDNWIFVWQHQFNPLIDNGWEQISHTLDDAEDASDIIIRFRLTTETSGSFGWNIDDLRITADYDNLPAPPPAPKVVEHFPAGDVIAIPAAVWIDFDQPMDAAGFSLGDLSEISGPDPAFDVVGFSWITDNRLRLDLVGTGVSGLYSLTLGTGLQSVEGDDLQAAYTATFDLTLYDPPLILTESLPMAHQGQAFSTALAAESPDDLPLGLSVAGRPPWLSFTDNGDGTGTLSGTPPETAAGQIALTFIADDTANPVQQTYVLEVNHPPLVNFETPLTQTVRIPEGVLLLFEGSVTDDGLPGGELMQSWTVLSQPPGGQASFEAPDALETAVAFDTEGTYQLRFTANDGVLSTIRDFTVEYGAEFGAGGGSPAWTAQDIGSGISTAGQTVYAEGVYTLGVNSGDIWGNADSFHFNWVEMTGDGELIARVNFNGSVNQWAKVGVMMRASLDANAVNAFALLSGNNGNRFQLRSTAGSSTSGHGSGTRSWVRLVRAGNVFSAFASDDGLDWVQLHQNETLDMPETVYAGLALSSHGSGGFAEAEFRDVSFSGAPSANVGPRVFAEATGVVQAGENVQLSGSVEDDGLPEFPGEVVIQWRRIEGPGTVAFGDAGSPETFVSFPQAGEYTLRLTAFDGEVLTAYDVTVNVETGEADSFVNWLVENGMDGGTNPNALDEAAGLTYHTLFVMGASKDASGAWQALLYAQLPGAAENGEMALRFTAQPGRRYTLEHTETLSDPQWEAVGGTIVVSDVEETTLQLDLPNASRAFYRIRVDLEAGSP